MFTIIIVIIISLFNFYLFIYVFKSATSFSTSAFVCCKCEELVVNLPTEHLPCGWLFVPPLHICPQTIVEVSFISEPGGLADRRHTLTLPLRAGERAVWMCWAFDRRWASPVRPNVSRFRRHASETKAPSQTNLEEWFPSAPHPPLPLALGLALLTPIDSSLFAVPPSPPIRSLVTSAAAPYRGLRNWWRRAIIATTNGRGEKNPPEAIEMRRLGWFIWLAVGRLGFLGFGHLWSIARAR